LQELKSSGLVQPWTPRFIHFPQKKKWQEEVLVSAPRMNSWAKSLASDVSLKLMTQITKIEWKDEQSTLIDQNGLTYGTFDWVISTAPWPQSQNLFGEHLVFNFPEMQAQKVYLLGFDQEFNLDFDVALFDDPVLEKMVVNSAKPGRQHGPSIVVYAKQELDIKQVIQDYLPFAPSYMDEHFWRFAYSKAVQKHDILFSTDRHWVVGGDWLKPSPGLEASLMVAEEIIHFILGKL
jgi:predicted NAD/FAD-dependent oxidoreductase